MKAKQSAARNRSSIADRWVPPNTRRVFQSVFDAPRVTVVGMWAVFRKARVELASDRGRVPSAKSVEEILVSAAIRTYLARLGSLVGTTSAPAALRPEWSCRGELAPEIRGAPEKPNGSWTYWTLVFETKWRPRSREALLVISAAIAGRALGSLLGPMIVGAVPIVTVRVHASRRSRRR